MRVLIFLTVPFLSACGYTHHPALGPITTTAPQAALPDPRWPITFTDLPTIRAESRPKASTSGITSTPAPKPTYTIGEPIGPGWITYNQPVTPANETPPPPTSFRYHAWRDRPEVLDSGLPGDDLGNIAALQASAHFRLAFHLWLPQDYLGTPSAKPIMPIRGLILYQWGLSGYRYEKNIVEALLKEHWAVLSPNGLAWRWPGAVVITPEAPPTAMINSDAGNPPSAGNHPPPLTKDELGRILAAAGRLAASEIDDAIGQYALATDAALTFVRRNYPQIPHSPLVVIGCSFGGLMSPTLIRRLDARPDTHVDAAILVGTGANLLEVIGDSWADSYYSRVRTGRGDSLHLPSSQRGPLYESYLRASSLDPFHSIVALRNKPVLMLHAAWDNLVPHECGDVLWERADRPERWVGNFGHIQMFLTFSWRADDLVAWINQRVPPTPH